VNPETYVRKVVRAHAQAARPRKADQMAKYMKDNFVFYGISSPERKPIEQKLIAAFPKPNQQDIVAVTKLLWAKPQRELQYFGVAFARKNVAVTTKSFITHCRFLIVNKPWWDTVDEIAPYLVGSLVLRYPELNFTMDQWILGGNMWLARAALLHQMRFKEDTNEKRLFRYCLLLGDDDEFFIRKAVGWSLREYAKTNPIAVRKFVNKNKKRLSPLAIREALKNL
jgi:3-methyladenine DNA glycosylase AlkD